MCQRTAGVTFVGRRGSVSGGERAVCPSRQSVIERLLLRLAAWQLRAPWQVLLIGLALTVTGAWLARGLELRTRFDQLLPGRPAVGAGAEAAERANGR